MLEAVNNGLRKNRRNKREMIQEIFLASGEMDQRLRGLVALDEDLCSVSVTHMDTNNPL